MHGAVLDSVRNKNINGVCLQSLYSIRKDSFKNVYTVCQLPYWRDVLWSKMRLADRSRKGQLIIQALPLAGLVILSRLLTYSEPRFLLLTIGITVSASSIYFNTKMM